MNYISSTEESYRSIMRIMRDIDKGFIIRFIHINGAIILFLLLNIHIIKGIYYSSYSIKYTWIIGNILYILMIIIAFLGYSLPYGQMSYWGVTVITNIITVIPFIGEDIKKYIWGDYKIGEETIKRFYVLHYLLPFLLLFFILLHIYTLHIKGGNNPIGLKEKQINIKTYYLNKDIFSFLSFLLFFIILIFFYPTSIGHEDNYIESNPLVTPTHIVPEIYLLPYYSILRSIPDKTLGVLVVLLNFILLIILPYIQPSITINKGYRFYYSLFLPYFIINYIYLGYMATRVVVKPYILLSLFLTLNYLFIFILFILISFFEFFLFFL